VFVGRLKNEGGGGLANAGLKTIFLFCVYRESALAASRTSLCSVVKKEKE
jgi:hypothetical protein